MIGFQWQPSLKSIPRKHIITIRQGLRAMKVAASIPISHQLCASDAVTFPLPFFMLERGCKPPSFASLPNILNGYLHPYL